MASDDVIFRFLDRGAIHGIPARDLTQVDFDRLSLLHQRDVRSGKLYAAVGPVDELPANSAPDIEAMTKAQIVAYASEHGIDLGDLDESDTKAALINAVQGGE